MIIAVMEDEATFQRLGQEARKHSGRREQGSLRGSEPMARGAGH